MSSEQTQSVHCARHPTIETGLRCGRCDTPICPRCLVMTPVGARCRPCAAPRMLPVFEAEPKHLILGLAAGLGTATAGALLLVFTPRFGLLTLFLYALLGLIVGEAVTRATNRKRATPLAIIASGCACSAALVAGLPTLGLPLAIVGAAIAGAVAWGRVR